MPGQTYIIPPTSMPTSTGAMPHCVSTTSTPESFNISTATLQPQFAPMTRQIIARPSNYNPHHGIIVPVSSNSRPGAGQILISAPPQQHIGVNELLRTESFSREGLQQSQVSQLPVVTIPPKNAGGQQIDLGQIVRQTITAPMSTISVEPVDQLQTNVSIRNPAINVANSGQQIIPMETDVDNSQVYSIPMSSYPVLWNIFQWFLFFYGN